MKQKCPKCGHGFDCKNAVQEETPALGKGPLAPAKWSAAFEISIPRIDSQHRRLVGLLIELSESIQISDLKDAQVLLALSEAERYVNTHMTEEEDLMKAVGYPEYADHYKAHNYFRTKVSEYRNQLSESLVSARVLSKFLAEWFVCHIRGADKAYADYIKINKIKIPELYEGV